jgi:hypothetical protein
MWNFHSGASIQGLLGCDTIQCCCMRAMFWKTLYPSSGWSVWCWEVDLYVEGSRTARDTMSQQESGWSLPVKRPLEGRGKKWKFSQQERGQSLSMKGPLASFTHFPTGLPHLYPLLLPAPTYRSTSHHHTLHPEDGGSKVLRNSGILL